MTGVYSAPVDDMLFAMRAANAFSVEGTQVTDPEIAGAVLREAANFFERAVAPGNYEADAVEARFVNGRVEVPDQIASAWKQYADAGWVGLHAPESYGGQGLSKVIRAAVTEMLNSSNLALGSGLLLCEGAIEALLIAGSEQQREDFLPYLVAGSWTGTMNLTESQAGSDLSKVSTVATPSGNHYLLKGQKVFITFGEQEFSENILHLVLARTVGAPDGIKGISLFLCPKFVPGVEGTKARNDIRCLSIEHKLGIKASPTCVLVFGEESGAIGYLVGKEHHGLEYMFLMMNAARFAVGIQGIGIAERAYQSAVAYAKDRVQGHPTGSEKGATIVYHPDVRRLLLSVRSQIEAARALAYFIAANEERAHDDAEAESDDDTRRIADFLIPIHKGHATEVSVELTSCAIQIMGGLGYIEDMGLAQYYRDARILPIYEGTTAIQANDLVGRKTLRDGGALALTLAAMMRKDAQDLDHTEIEGAGRASAQLNEAIDQYEQVVRWLLITAESDLPGVYSAAVPYLRLCGYVFSAWQMVRGWKVTQEEDVIAAFGEGFLAAKRVNAEFYLSWILPQCEALAKGIQAGATRLMASDPNFL